MKRLLFLLVAVVMTMPAFAGEGRGYLQRIAKDLNLTPPQKEQVKAILSKNRDAVKSKRQEVRQLRQDLAAALQAPKKGDDYRKDLMAKYDKIEELRNALQRQRFETALEIRELLNDDQIAKLKEVHFGGKHHSKGGPRKSKGDSESDE